MQPARLFGDVDAQAQQLLGGTWSESVTTNLVARKRALFEQRDREALVCKPARRRRAGGAGPDDDDLRLLVGPRSLLVVTLFLPGWASPV